MKAIKVSSTAPQAMRVLHSTIWIPALQIIVGINPNSIKKQFNIAVVSVPALPDSWEESTEITLTTEQTVSISELAVAAQAHANASKKVDAWFDSI